MYPVSEPWIGKLEADYVARVLASGQLTQGPMVAEFEQRLATYLGVEHVVACSSGTTALHLATACLLQPGAEVLVPDVTFVASANAVTYAGAVPVLCDIDPLTWSISLESAAQKLTPNTKAILVVHLYGQAAPMDQILAFAEKHHLIVIEDAAEGFTASFNGRALGTWGHVGTFSFYGNKILTCGEGGAVVTNSGVLADRIRLLRGQAMSPDCRYFHTEVGFNYRMTEMQAAVGCAQMDRLAELVTRRAEVMDAYQSVLSSFYQTVSPNSAPWLFTFVTPMRVRVRELQQILLEKKIDSRPVFVPLHRLPMYASDEVFPVASQLGTYGLSLPTSPLMSPRDAEYIAKTVHELIYLTEWRNASRVAH